MESECVRVAVNIRPLVMSELLLGCTDCISVVPGEPQVQIGSHSFTYDNVYGSTGLPSSAMYDDCVAPLVDAVFNGYNATVLAYAQTGSGKTYTMGTNYNGGGSSGGIIPRVLETIFNRIKATNDSTEFLIRVSFIEIFKEEVFDLLDPNSSKGEAASTAKVAAPARVPLQIRETVDGRIILAGVTEADVKTQEEMTSYLSSGSLSRATGSTNMNSPSSRSHAIFTITMEQKKGADILCAKLHLVDLAGSERVKRTGADGLRLKEGIHINKGLLALGNVISALGDEKKQKGGHVPYRDSKLTRLLQDSLGGNSKTVMIACVSPADTSAEETLNTLKYANRARNIQNKAVINRDPVEAQLQTMRNQIKQLQAELLFYKGDTAGPIEELQILKHKISLLEASNVELQHELKRCQVEKDQLILKIESIRNGKSWDEIDSNSNQDYDLLKSYVSKIQDLEGELLSLKTSNATNPSHFVDCADSDDDGYGSKLALFAHGVGGGNGPGVQALMKAIENDIEVNVRVHEVRSEYERQKEVTAKMAEEMMKLEEEAQMVKQNSTSDCPTSMSPAARNSRIFALKNMLSTSATLLSMFSQLSEAEEDERVFSGKGRWYQVLSLADAKNLMNYLFNIASSSRCSLRDKEVICREKDMEIRDLKEKVVGLSYSLRQLEMTKAELTHKLKLQSEALIRYSEYVGDSEYSDLNVGGHKYDLRKSEYHRSTHLLEDMGISETESDDYDSTTDDEWEESGKIRVRKRKSKTRRTGMENNQSNINNSEDFKENSRDILVDTPGETASDICCSCSRNSSCKTTKCKCKAMGSICGSSCGCQATKCANRASISSESQEPTQSASIEGSDKDRLLVTKGLYPSTVNFAL